MSTSPAWKQGHRLQLHPGGSLCPRGQESGRQIRARDLRRVIRKAVEDPAAERIIDGTLKAGGSLTVDAENGEVILK